MQAMQWHAARSQSESNFGIAEGGWLQIAIADIGFDAFIVGYANDRIVGIVKRPDWGFDGLIGLPLLRMLEYGGDRGFFWVRKSIRREVTAFSCPSSLPEGEHFGLAFQGSTRWLSLTVCSRSSQSNL